MHRANLVAHVATDARPVPVQQLTHHRAIHLALNEDDELRTDERVTAPIYNYARFLPWVQSVETVAQAFRNASIRYRQHQSVDNSVQWVEIDLWERPHERNRIGNELQVKHYCSAQGLPGSARRSRWGPSVISRIVTASALAILLTWGTVGAAIVIVFHTPTTGKPSKFIHTYFSD